MKILISIMAFLVLINNSFALDGGMEAGGGKGVICGNTVRVLDLYEAEEVYQLPRGTQFQNLKDSITHYAIYAALYKSETGFDPTNQWDRDILYDFFESEIFHKFRDIPEGETLPFTHDATLPHLPDGCSFVQIALYNDREDIIYLDKSLWGRLTPYDQAALAYHEGVYHFLRTEGELNSDRTRYFMGIIFSETLPEPVFKPLWSSRFSVWCGVPDDPTSTAEEKFEFYAIEENKNNQDGVGIYFTTFKSKGVFERYEVFIPGMNGHDFFHSSDTYITNVYGSMFENISWKLELKPIYDNGYKLHIRAWKDLDTPTNYSSIECEYRI